MTNQLNAKEQNSDYILSTSSIGAKKLEQQQKRLELASLKQLQKAGIKKGMVIWDVGCGPALMTEQIASLVGAEGHVYAIDISDEFLTLGKERIAKSGLKNVTFISGDIRNIVASDFPKADIVYSRLVLMHIKNPSKSLQKMIELLKPDGVMCLQESTMSTAHLSVQNQDVEDFYLAMIALGKSKGGDFNIGRKLPSMCSELNFQKIETYTNQYKLDSISAKSAILGRIEEIKSKLIEGNFVTPEKIKKWEETVNYLPNDDSFYLSSAEQTHILAWKKQ